MPTFRSQAAEDVQESRERNSNSGSDESESLDQINVDMGSVAFTHFHPTTIPTGVFPEDEGNPIIRFPDEENNEHRHQGYLGLVLDDPDAIVDSEEGTENTVIVDVEDSNEVRVFNEDDSGTTVDRDAGLVTYDPGQGERVYRGEFVDEFPVDRTILVVSGTAARSVAQKLDVNGAEIAGMDEETGQVNDGLIEYNPDDNADVRWRYARPRPELREELYGSRIGVLLTRREEIDDENTGFDRNLFDEESYEWDEEYEDGERVAHGNPNEASYAELVDAGLRRSMKWFSVFADTGDGFEALEPTDGEPVADTWLEWSFDPDVGPDRLPDEDFEFVRQYLDAGLDTDEETIRTNIEQNRGDLSGEVDDDRIVERIQIEAE